MAAYKNLSLNQVRLLAQTLAHDLRARSAVIGLTGPLGSGKTVFAKAFGKGLGLKKITSPTFVIMHEYRAKMIRLYHLDLYRLKKQSELKGLGLNEIRMHPRRIILIEWVEKFPKLKKSCDLLVTFKVNPNDLRDITVKTA